MQRRAIAGLLWSKQNYIFDVASWLDGEIRYAKVLAGLADSQHHAEIGFASLVRLQRNDRL